LVTEKKRFPEKKYRALGWLGILAWQPPPPPPPPPPPKNRRRRRRPAAARGCRYAFGCLTKHDTRTSMAANVSLLATAKTVLETASLTTNILPPPGN
jgi:hypothetical protein